MVALEEIKRWVAGWVNGRFFPRSSHQSTSRGTSSKGLPVVLGRDGLLDSSFLDAGALGPALAGATAKSTPVDADTLPLIDSAASSALKKVSWASIKTTLKSYFDTLYVALSGNQTIAGVKTFSSAVVLSRIAPPAVNVANGALGALSVWTPVTNGILIVHNVSFGTAAIFAVRASLNTVVEMSDASGQFSATPGTASSVNVYYLGGTGYVIQNNMGSGAFVSVLAIGVP